MRVNKIWSTLKQVGLSHTVVSELSNFRNLCVARHRLTPHPDINVGTPGLKDALRLYLSNLLSSDFGLDFFVLFYQEKRTTFYEKNIKN